MSLFLAFPAPGHAVHSWGAWSSSSHLFKERKAKSSVFQPHFLLTKPQRTEHRLGLFIYFLYFSFYIILCLFWTEMSTRDLEITVWVNQPAKISAIWQLAGNTIYFWAEGKDLRYVKVRVSIQSYLVLCNGMLFYQDTEMLTLEYSHSHSL